MRAELGRTTLHELAQGVGSKAPAGFTEELQGWFSDRVQVRTEARVAAITGPKSRRKHGDAD